MKAILLPALIPLVLATLVTLVTISPAQTCREVVRDSSGRIVQTIERQTQAGGTERAVIRDSTGRIVGTATTHASGGNTIHTRYRDASGRLSGSAATHGSHSGSSRTTYQDASGGIAGSATTSRFGSSGRTQFRDASGRLSGSESTHGNGTRAAPAVMAADASPEVGHREVPGRGSSACASAGDQEVGGTPMPRKTTHLSFFSPPHRHPLFPDHLLMRFLYLRSHVRQTLGLGGLESSDSEKQTVKPFSSGIGLFLGEAFRSIPNALEKAVPFAARWDPYPRGFCGVPTGEARQASERSG